MMKGGGGNMIRTATRGENEARGVKGKQKGKNPEKTPCDGPGPSPAPARPSGAITKSSRPL